MFLIERHSKCFPGHSIFYENETVYKDIVAHLSALAILNANDRHALSILKEILARTVLGNAFWSCHLAVDIWSLLGRYLNKPNVDSLILMS